MSKISQRRALLLAAIVPAMLVAGCAAGGNSSQAMKGAASPMTPTDTMMSPDDTDMSPPIGTDTGTASPTETGGAGQARSVVQGFFDALKSGNADQAAGKFADDAVVALDGEPTAKGSDAIAKLFKDRLQDMKGQTHTIEESRAAGGDNAIVRATSKQDDEESRELFVVTRNGGEWKISQFMSNQAA
ncbi:YybH family protein [Nonomuraea basaltis]|uniref:YybH family protein n=1 Tax=Nonomuraea basaltis TaxID=2495887 RepID=UPI00110C6D3B|nr:nuclear transport factor 2 family protein [Nonomuraea basaltis]TMR96742.1 DUF4440 domain-containing protein [Nonomuraea basaltis]